VENTAAARYAELEPLREPYLRRARHSSRFTLPALIPPEGWTGAEDLPEPWNNLGARGVNCLASKLLLTLFPPGTPCFRNKLDPQARLEIEKTLRKSEGENWKQSFDAFLAQADSAMADIEQRFVDFTEANQSRVSMEEVFKHLICAGNSLLHFPEKGGVRVFRLDKYVILRDPSGLFLEAVVKECVARAALPPAVVALLGTDVPTAASADPASPDARKAAAKTVDLYTHVYRANGKYRVYQQIENIVVPGSSGSYPEDKCPWLPLRWSKIDSESYGWGHVHHFLGDLSTLDMLSQALAEGAAAAARVIYLKKPGSVGKADDLVKAKNGAVFVAEHDAYKALTLEKFADFQTAHARVQELERNLSFAFLLNTAIQRKGERVTAEEIRYMAQELNDALGGVYSVLSQELQLPFVTVTLHVMGKQKAIPKLPPEVKPSIVTGLEALGRGNDLNKLDLFVGGAVQAAGEHGAAAINWDEYMRRRGVALGIDTAGLVKTPQEIAAAQQQEQMLMMAQQLGPQAINQLGGVAKTSLQNASKERIENGKATREQPAAPAG
jgi:hypothetical protein